MYSLYDPNLEQITYVGRTKNLRRRLEDHKKNKYKSHLELVEYYHDLTYEQSRGKEQ